jgi:hypothetical protein
MLSLGFNECCHWQNTSPCDFMYSRIPMYMPYTEMLLEILFQSPFRTAVMLLWTSQSDSKWDTLKDFHFWKQETVTSSQIKQVFNTSNWMLQHWHFFPGQKSFYYEVLCGNKHVVMMKNLRSQWNNWRFQHMVIVDDPGLTTQSLFSL